MSFTDANTLALTPAFIERVRLAVVTAAINVAAEDTATPGHARRAEYARYALGDSAHVAAQFAFGVASNPVITAASTDNDIQFTVNAIWNAFAGIILE